jgi:hypothetical protein
MRLTCAISLTLLAFIGPAFGASSAPIWVEERVYLGAAVRNGFVEELKANRYVPVDFVRFSSQSLKPSSETITITVRTSPPDPYPKALGLAWRSGNRILPRLEVYVNSLMRIFGGRIAPSELGRALARIVVHELLHYTRQRSDHDAAGIFNESLGPADLVLGRSEAPKQENLR